VGVEIKEHPVDDEEFAEMQRFVHDYLEASVDNEEDGGRMRWYPWHSAEYRFNHIMNVVELGARIADREGADVDVVRVAALFHDIAKLEADQDVHAEAGAHVAREYLETHGEFPPSFVDRVCAAIEDHSNEGAVDELPLETQCLIEADLLDKVGANGAVLMLLRMGYEARTHMEAGEVVDRVLERGEEKVSLVESDTAESIGYQRLKRVKWLLEWLDTEVPRLDVESPDREE